jgi:hypothetical protein
MYELRVHGLRKYSKTQMLALGVQPDYVDYMMGHHFGHIPRHPDERNRIPPQHLRIKWANYLTQNQSQQS